MSKTSHIANVEIAFQAKGTVNAKAQGGTEPRVFEREPGSPGCCLRVRSGERERSRDKSVRQLGARTGISCSYNSLQIPLG